MKHLLMILMLALTLTAFGCADNAATSEDKSAADQAELAPWMNVELTDVRTGETFKISDFIGTPVLLETFAVWCSTCKRQQDEIDKLHNKIGKDVVSISIDTDPNESGGKVKEHLERHGFNWRFAVDADDFSRMLVDDFGINVVNAPSAPVILIDEKGRAELLRFGVKKADELERTIEESRG